MNQTKTDLHSQNDSIRSGSALSSLAGVAGLSLLLFLDGGRGKASAL
ncbi:hypothetical protein GOD17_24125 [Sinorhizobium medicae]|nr:hypothetical protein [Sinorhizobium medicae]